MRFYIIALLCFVSTLVSCGQKNVDVIVNEFIMTKNDSLFISKYSKLPFQKRSIEKRSLTQTFEPFDSLIFYHQQKGDVLGPVYLENFQYYVKILTVDSILKMRVGNIYIGQNRHKCNVDKLSNEILQTIIKKGNFDEMCKKYSKDNNKKYQCDVGWFFQGAMVNEFESEVLKHKKGDCFIVTTRFGKHIVKILDTSTLERNKVEYVLLCLDK